MYRAFELSQRIRVTEMVLVSPRIGLGIRHYLYGCSKATQNRPREPPHILMLGAQPEGHYTRRIASEDANNVESGFGFIICKYLS